MQDKLIKILIPAIGGQGGGVLTEWLIQAFELKNFDVQGISLPGLSQRAGSTIYYIEACLNSDNERIVFSQHPLPGDIDLIISHEFLELGRVLEKGFGSEKTTIISSTHRIYSTEEKLPISSGIYSRENLQKIAEEFSSRFIGIDVLQVAKDNGMNELSANAILLGVLSSSQAIPVSKETLQKAIETTGVSTENNLSAFKIGYDCIKGDKNYFLADKSPEEQNDELYKYIDEKDRKKIQCLASEIEKNYPKFLVPLMSEAIVRLTDYQGFWYAERYLNEIEEIKKHDLSNPDKDFRLSECVIKNLALMMSYEDGIRVSELKIRDDRFKRIKKEMQISDDQVFSVVDYLKPDAEEVYGLFPNTLVAPILALLDSKVLKKVWTKKDPLTVSQKPTTTSFWGFFRIWMLSKFKFMRPYSFRFKKEHEIIELYLKDVERFAKADYELGVLAARSGSIIKGYGRVRRRTVDSYKRLINNIVTKLYDYDLEQGKGFDKTRETFAESIKLISKDESGIDKAEKLAEQVLQ